MVTAPSIFVISVISVSLPPLFAVSLFVATTARIVLRKEALRTSRRRHQSRKKTHARARETAHETRPRTIVARRREGGRESVSGCVVDSGSPMMMVTVVMMTTTMVMVMMVMMMVMMVIMVAMMMMMAMMMVHRCTSR